MGRSRVSAAVERTGTIAVDSEVMSTCGDYGGVNKSGGPCKIATSDRRCGLHQDGVPSPNGRPTVYTEAIATEIIERIAEGEPLRRVCADDHLPHPRTVRGWVLENRSGFSPLYARARELCLDAWADEIVEIADDGRNDTYVNDRGNEVMDGDVVQRSRLRVDTRKWLMSRLRPSKYGDRIDIGSSPDRPVKVDLTRLTDDELDTFEQLARRAAALN